MTPPRVVLNGHGARRARRGHPWIYQDDVLEAEGAPGDIVRADDRSGGFCCWAAFSPASRITLRRVSTAPEPPGEAFWRARVQSALARRGAAASAGAGCARLLHADADGLPGLTLDRYGAHLVLQATTAWADRVAADLALIVLEETGAASVLARNDPAVRELEALPRGVAQLAGETPAEIVVEEAGVTRFVDPWRGHKTGLYLDQQENHRRAVEWLAGPVLDLFSADGGFAVPLAAAGRDVTAVDQSAALLARAARAAEAASSSGRSTASALGRITFVEDNAFDVLTRLSNAGERFGAIVLDPPPFARRRAEIAGAIRGYRDLNRRALRALAPGGRLLTFSCSYAIDEAAFEAVVREAAEEAGIDARVIARPGPAPDHPEVLTLPESRYLKGLLIERPEA